MPLLNNLITVSGHLAKPPLQREVPIKNGAEKAKITELIVIDGARKKQGDAYVDDPENNQIYDVTVWDETHGDALNKLLTQGAGVTITGILSSKPSIDGKGRAYANLAIAAERVSLDVHRIESVVYKTAKSRV